MHVAVDAEGAVIDETFDGSISARPCVRVSCNKLQFVLFFFP